MARLPDFTALPQNDPRATGRVVQFPTVDPVNTATAELGAGLAKAGGAAVNIADEMGRDRDKLNESNATLALAEPLIRLNAQAAIETDPEKLAEIKKQYDTLLPNASQALADNPLRQKMWMATHTKTILEAHAALDKRSTLIARDRTIADSMGRIDSLVRSTVASPDPMALPNAELIINDNIDLQIKNGLSAEAGQKRRQAQIEELYKGTADRLAQTDPVAAIDFLNKNPTKVDATTTQARIARYRPMADRKIALAGKERGRPGAVSGGDAGERVAATLRARGWSDAAIVGALNNSITESSLDPNAKGAAGEEGLFQFHPSSHITPFQQKYKGDRSPEAQANYVADVVERDMPGYSKIADSRAATGEFLRGFEKPKDQSDRALSERAANDSASRTILGRASGGTSKAAASAPRPFTQAIGDSIAAGVMGAAKLPGDAVGGRSTQQVLDAIIATDPVLLKGQRIFLSSGASNSPDALDLVPQQLAAMKAAGADVVLSGVGSGVKNYQAVNAKLAEYAKAAGVPFSGEIPGTQGGRVHPRDYAPLAKQAAGIGGVSSAPAPGAPSATPPPGVPDVRAWVDRIKADPALTEEQKDIAIREVQQEQQQAMLGHAQAESDLTLAIARGEKGRPDVEQAYQAQRISPQKRTQLHGAIDKIEAEQNKLAQGVARVSSAGNGGAPLDPKSKDDRAYLNFHYGAVSKAWPAEEVLDRSLAYSAQYGMVPAALQARIRGGLHSGRPELAIEAARTVNRLRNANPQLVAEIGDENDLRLATVISERADAGVPPERALELAVEGMKVTKAVREARGDEYNALRGPNEIKQKAADTAWLGKQLNYFWARDPNADPVMLQEFEDTAKAEFQITGNLEAARQMALRSVNNIWMRTRVGGDFRYMKNAPEMAYAVPNMTADEMAAWQNEQLVIDAGKARPIGAPPIAADKLKVLVYPGKTDQNGRPLYQVFVVDDKGAWEVLRKPGGLPIEWQPDFARSLEFKRQLDAKAAEVEKAKTLRREEFERQEFERRRVVDPVQP